MRIAIDARMMGPLETRGIGRYAEELVRAMVKQSDHRFVLLCRNPDLSPFHGHDSVEHIKADVPWYGWREQWEMPRFFRVAKADLVHVPHWNVPIGWRGSLAVTIHDVLLLRQPASAKASTLHPFTAHAKRLAFRFVLRNAIRRASVIFTPTQFTADEVRYFFPAADHKLIVTGAGLTDFPSDGSPRDPLSVLQGSSYLLYVGSAYPHKRLDLLLTAWHAVSRAHPDLHLVIAGEEDVFMARYVADVHRTGLPRVIFTGRVSDHELSTLYRHARLFVFPSSYEGFGLPPLEALSFGVPVAASDTPVLREVLPERGIFFFRNGDADAMIRAIECALESQEPPPLPRAHSWVRAAKHTLAGYESIVKTQKDKISQAGGS